MQAYSHLFHAHPSSSYSAATAAAATFASLERLLLGNCAKHEFFSGPCLFLGLARRLGPAAEAEVVNRQGQDGHQHGDDDDRGEGG